MLGPEKSPCRALFIRAPAILEVDAAVSVLASLVDDDGKTVVVAAEQDNLTVTAFHVRIVF